MMASPIYGWRGGIKVPERPLLEQDEVDIAPAGIDDDNSSPLY